MHYLALVYLALGVLAVENHHCKVDSDPFVTLISHISFSHLFSLRPGNTAANKRLESSGSIAVVTVQRATTMQGRLRNANGSTLRTNLNYFAQHLTVKRANL